MDTMRWGVVALVCVAACGGQGVDLEVDADVAFDRVELFIAYDHCYEKNGNPCEQGIGWPDQIARPPGSVFVLRDDERLISTTKIVDGAAVLHLEASAGFEEPKAIAIAAYEGTRVVAATIVWDARIPIHSAERWKVHLQTTDVASTKTNVAPGAEAPNHRALAWPREVGPDLPDPSDYAGCFVFQEWTGSEWDSKYFVPETDMDCDGAPPDCTPYWNHYNPMFARCAAKQAVSSFCVLGTPTCSGETPGTMCAPNMPMTCLPAQVCASCEGAPDLDGCVKNLLDAGISSTLTGAKCRFQVDSNTQGPCTTSMYGSTAQLDLPVPCPNAMAVLRDPSMPLSAGSSTITTPEGAVYEVTATSDLTTCTVGIAWKSGPVPQEHQYILALTCHCGRCSCRSRLAPIR